MTSPAKRYRIIFNSDGGDVERHEAATREGFLGVRAKALEGTQVDAISFCSHYSFNSCLHDTKVGELSVPVHGRPCHAKTMIDSGRDCLGVIVDWAHANGIDGVRS